MARMAGSIGCILAVPLLGCTRTCQMAPESSITGLDGTYRTAGTYRGQAGTLWSTGAKKAVVALAVRREDRSCALACEAPDRRSRSARRFNRVGPRGVWTPSSRRSHANCCSTPHYPAEQGFSENQGPGSSPAGRLLPGTLPMTGG